MYEGAYSCKAPGGIFTMCKLSSFRKYRDMGYNMSFVFYNSDFVCVKSIKIILAGITPFSVNDILRHCEDMTASRLSKSYNTAPLECFHMGWICWGCVYGKSTTNYSTSNVNKIFGNLFHALLKNSAQCEWQHVNLYCRYAADLVWIFPIDLKRWANFQKFGSPGSGIYGKNFIST